MIAMNEPSAIRIALLGSGGMLGRTLEAAGRARGYHVRSFDGPDALDITDPEAFDALNDGTEAPDIVLNATAWTDVDGAESNEPEAARVNAEAPGALAAWCAARHALFVHYSTDYVFDGQASAPIQVSAPTAPLNAYGRTKRDGEDAVQASGADHLILRTSWLFAPHGSNFVRTMVQLGRERDVLNVVDDQWGRPTSCATLSDLTFELIAREARGIWHACNDGQTTWCGFARAIMGLAGLDCRVDACGTDAFPRPAERPAYGVLDLAETQRRVGVIPTWQSALEACLREMGQVRSTV